MSDPCGNASILNLDCINSLVVILYNSFVRCCHVGKKWVKGICDLSTLFVITACVSVITLEIKV